MNKRIYFIAGIATLAIGVGIGFDMRLANVATTDIDLIKPGPVQQFGDLSFEYSPAPSFKFIPSDDIEDGKPDIFVTVTHRPWNGDWKKYLNVPDTKPIYPVNPQYDFDTLPYPVIEPEPNYPIWFYVPPSDNFIPYVFVNTCKKDDEDKKCKLIHVPHISPVPEPSTWAEMIVGFFSIGLIRRKQYARSL